MVRGTGPTRAEEWKDPEPPADDDPQPDMRTRPAGPGEDGPPPRRTGH
jgi:hypothetical protein